MDHDEARLLEARSGNEGAFAETVARHRADLVGHCYRMTGSLAEAEDAVQETLLRAWRGLPQFEGRASMSTWLRTIATRACLDALENRPSRVLPFALGPSAGPDDPVVPIESAAWLDPVPDAWLSAAQNPEARYGWRESVALAFLVALQRLAPRQRAVLLMREVLGMTASEVAEALDASVDSINSALQRARETLNVADDAPAATATPEGEVRELLHRYVAAWEQADASALMALLREDSTLSMPPLGAWFRGARAIVAALAGMVLPAAARGRFRLLPASANGLPALACYAREGDAYHPMALHLLRVEAGSLAEIVAFLDPGLFGRFGLPASIRVAEPATTLRGGSGF